MSKAHTLPQQCEVKNARDEQLRGLIVTLVTNRRAGAVNSRTTLTGDDYGKIYRANAG